MTTKLENDGKDAPIKKTWANLSDDESEDETRIVRSARDKRYELVRLTIKRMHNHKRNQDFSALSNDYVELLSNFEKMKQIVESDGVAPFFIRCLADLELFLGEVFMDKTVLKKMSKHKHTEFNKLRAAVKKLKDDPLLGDLIAKCKEDNTNFESIEDEDEKNDDEGEKDKYCDEESSDESESESSEKTSDSSASSSSSSNSESNEDSDDDDWGSSDSSSSDSDEGPSVPQGDAEDRSSRWLLKDSSKLQATRMKKDRRVVERGDDKNRQERDVRVERADRLQQRIQTDESLREVLLECVQSRGRKGKDRDDNLNTLRILADQVTSYSKQTQADALYALLQADFDTAPSALKCMSSDHWSEACNTCSKMLDIVSENADVMIRHNVLSDQAESITFYALQNTAERLDDELSKSLKLLDSHSQEYTQRLAHSTDLICLCYKVLRFFICVDATENASAVALRIMEQLNYRHEDIVAKVWEAVDRKLPPKLRGSKEYMTMEELFELVQRSQDKRRCLRATLAISFRSAMQGDYFKARDLTTLGNLQDRCSVSDVETQILYNRNLAQLGLSAFRIGRMHDAHACLSEIRNFGRARELLAQGLSSTKVSPDKTAEQEAAERRRQLAYHMYLSLDAIECLHLISAMLLEVPHMASSSDKLKVISSTFRRQLDIFERNVFSGPPENSRECVMAGARCLQKGNWKECCDHIFSLRLWDGFPQKDQVKENLKHRIKIEALRTYLFEYGSYYDAFSLEELANFFQLPESTVHAVVSKIIIGDDFPASWDETSKFVVVRRVERSKAQQLSLHLAEKISNLRQEKGQMNQTQDLYRGNRGGRDGFTHRPPGMLAAPRPRGSYGMRYPRGGGGALPGGARFRGGGASGGPVRNRGESYWRGATHNR
eukprot:GHVL01008365.1.p1 GENE.GHVL01008365.1~~GHVL01008365.1.p1  ORF type:complete len:892 (-),score=131.99 GHVL01008365.1:91-2766(-)